MRKLTHLRRHERLPLVVRVRFRLGDLPQGLEADPVDALAADLCEGGIYLRAPLAALLTPGALVDLEIDAGRHGSIQARARVAHRREDGCGLRFLPLDMTTARRLFEILEAGRRHLWAQSLAQAKRHLGRKPRLL
jgi:PilZ domain-containing protein